MLPLATWDKAAAVEVVECVTADRGMLVTVKVAVQRVGWNVTAETERGPELTVLTEPNPGVTVLTISKLYYCVQRA